MSSKHFGELIREKRTIKKLTLRTFADRVGLSPTYVSQFERGHVAPPPVDRIRKMAEVLEADADELIVAAGRMAEDVAGLIEKRPIEMASFLRHAKGLTPQQVEQLTKMAEDMSKTPKKEFERVANICTYTGNAPDAEPDPEKEYDFGRVAMARVKMDTGVQVDVDIHGKAEFGDDQHSVFVERQIGRTFVTVTVGKDDAALIIYVTDDGHVLLAPEGLGRLVPALPPDPNPAPTPPSRFLTIEYPVPHNPWVA